MVRPLNGSPSTNKHLINNNENRKALFSKHWKRG